MAAPEGTAKFREELPAKWQSHIAEPSLLFERVLRNRNVICTRNDSSQLAFATLFPKRLLAPQARGRTLRRTPHATNQARSRGSLVKSSMRSSAVVICRAK